MLNYRRKIMVAVDGSAVSDKAVAEAVWLTGCQSGKFKNILYALFVKTDRVQDYDELIASGLVARSEEETRERWQQITDEVFLVLRKLATEKGIEFETLVREGNPAETIVHEAAELDIDLLVIGSTGKGAVKRAFLGSVSAEVVQQAACGVYVVRA